MVQRSVQFVGGVRVAKPEFPDGVAAAMTLEEAVLVALRVPSLTPEERDTLEKAVRIARSLQKCLRHPGGGPGPNLQAKPRGSAGEPQGLDGS